MISPRRGSVDGRGGLPVIPEPDCAGIQVAVDGDVKMFVLAYDIDAGWADVAMRTDAGHLILRDGQPKPKRVYGVVTVLP